MSNTIGWSDFARKQHHISTGNTYTTLEESEVIARVLHNWGRAVPGNGETTLERKILVPVQPDGFFCPPRAKLVKDLPVQAVVKFRQEGEDPYIETFVEESDARYYNALVITPASKVEVVCYSAEALAENNGTRSTTADWEIVCLLATDGEREPMQPLVMARNFLEKPGGTKSVYSAQEFAEAIYHHGSQRGIRVRLIDPAQQSQQYHDLRWGTYGPEGKGPLQWKRLGDCDDDHLKAILRTQPIGPHYHAAINHILQERGMK